MTSSFDAFAAASRVAVEQALDRALPRPPACPAAVADAMRYSVTAGGKRLRPILVLAAADAVAAAHGAPAETARRLALPAACALEMIHTYSLIHDDLPAMDDDSLRRGRPTLHVVVGDGMAILAGDGLQAAAFALLAREPADAGPADAARRLRVIAEVAAAAGPEGMVGGQAIDLGAAGRTAAAVPLDAAGLADMHARKTGALIRAAAVSGAVMAGADGDQERAITAWATDIGLAFQIVDDVLDVEGASADLGKTSGKDAADGKPTYPAFYGLARSKALAAEAVARADRALAAAGLADSHLPAIARWIVERRS
ncbi:MAG: polyprenyl synthetase family protein [Vicinamibacterales bacterium]